MSNLVNRALSMLIFIIGIDQKIVLQEYELIPFLLDIGHSHFPSMCSGVSVYNHSWATAGLWTIVKRVLPQRALDKISFLKDSEMREKFDSKTLPRGRRRHLIYSANMANWIFDTAYGGELEYKYDKRTNHVLQKFRHSAIHTTSSIASQVSSREQCVENVASRSTASYRPTALSMSTLDCASHDPPSPSASASSSSTVLPSRPIITIPTLPLCSSLSTVAPQKNQPNFRLHLPSDAISFTPRPSSPQPLTRSLSPSSHVTSRSPSPSVQRRFSSSLERPPLTIQEAEASNAYKEVLRKHHRAGMERSASQDSARSIYTSPDESEGRNKFGAVFEDDVIESGDELTAHNRSTSISRYDPSNPRFGYSAEIVERDGKRVIEHGRRRKRDLLKTLLFLALLRVQSAKGKMVSLLLPAFLRSRERDIEIQSSENPGKSEVVKKRRKGEIELILLGALFLSLRGVLGSLFGADSQSGGGIVGALTDLMGLGV